MPHFLETIQTLSCWYSLESSPWVLSYEYLFARVSVIFHNFFHHFVLAKLATSSIRVKYYGLMMVRQFYASSWFLRIFNPLMLAAAKSSLTILVKSFKQNEIWEDIWRRKSWLEHFQQLSFNVLWKPFRIPKLLQKVWKEQTTFFWGTLKH